MFKKRQLNVLLALLLVGAFGCRPVVVAPLPVKLKPTLVVFSADWCQPCQRAKPVVEWLSKRINVTHYDIDKQPDVARQYKITAVPTFILNDLRTHDIKEVVKALGIEEEFAKVFASTLTTDTLTSCSRWAAARRVMGGDFSGPYSTKYHPWCKSLHDTRAGFNYVMKGAQLGVTEVAINRALYTLDKLKRDVLYVLPTAKGASKFSKGRFSTALSLSPYLKGMFTDLNSIDLKQAGNCTLYLSGSKGNNNLKNIPVSELILDEVDEMEQKQIWLALERLSGQLRKCVWGISTPTVPEHGIHKLYKDSTQEHFVFQCPSCSKWTELVWPDCVEIIGEYATDARCSESYLKCKECKAKLDQQAKPDFLATGRWEKTAATPNPDVRGFYINQLYSFTVNAGELVTSYLRGFGDAWAATEFWNSKLGLPFVGEGAKVTEQMIEAATADHSIGDVRPDRAGRLITMGADQGDLFHVVVTEWLIDRDITHDLSAGVKGKVLWAEKWTSEDWSHMDELMREFQVLFCVVDGDPHTNEARAFARRYPGYAALTRYRRGKVAREIGITEEDTGAPMLTVDRTSWLGGVLNRFKTNPTRILLPHDLSSEFKQHIMNTVRVYKVDEQGNQVAAYINTGADHYAHGLCYSEIALHQASLMLDNRIGKVI